MFACVLPLLRPRAGTFRLTTLLLVLLASTPMRAAADDQEPVQATWIAPSDVDTPDAIRRAITSAVARGTRTLIADATLHAESADLRLLELLRQAHEQGVRVFASLDITRVARGGDLPASRNHVLYQHPEWLMVPRPLATDLLTLDVRSPDYIGRLARWTRAEGLDGLYLSPAIPEAAAYVADAVVRFLARHPVDGIHLEAAWYPAVEFDFGRRTIESFRRDISARLPHAERLRLDEAQLIDPFAYPSEFDDDWRRFRQATLTGLVGRIRSGVRTLRQDVAIAAALPARQADAVTTHLQDWRTWLDSGFVDVVGARSGESTTLVSDVAAISAGDAVTGTTGSH